VAYRELSEDQHRRLLTVLERVRMEHRARLVLLAETSGQPLAVCGDCGAADVEGLSSLAASALAAAADLGRALGEPGAAVAVQRAGREILQLVPNGETLLALAFGPEPLLDLERVRARLRLTRALEELRAVLLPSEGASPGFTPSDHEIEEALAGMGAREA
jgi:hypothetical protein